MIKCLLFAVLASFVTVSFAKDLTPAQQKKVEEQYNYCISAMTALNDPNMDVKGYCEASRDMLISLKDMILVEKEVTVTAYGKSHDKRLNDALTEAVQIVTGAHVISEVEVTNSELTKDYAQVTTIGYVKSYKVLNETNDSITIKAVVDYQTSHITKESIK